jgi:Ser-tRNA(Ala) deacylase AlaX
METITPLQISQKINSLPITLLLEVDKYIDFLKYKYSQSDLAEKITEQQMQLVEKGKKDIDQNRIMSHNEAKETIKNHIKNRSL